MRWKCMLWREECKKMWQLRFQAVGVPSQVSRSMQVSPLSCVTNWSDIETDQSFETQGTTLEPSTIKKPSISRSVLKDCARACVCVCVRAVEWVFPRLIWAAYKQWIALSFRWVTAFTLPLSCSGAPEAPLLQLSAFRIHAEWSRVLSTHIELTSCKFSPSNYVAGTSGCVMIQRRVWISKLASFFIGISFMLSFITRHSEEHRCVACNYEQDSRTWKFSTSETEAQHWKCV